MSRDQPVRRERDDSTSTLRFRLLSVAAVAILVPCLTVSAGCNQRLFEDNLNTREELDDWSGELDHEGEDGGDQEDLVEVNPAPELCDGWDNDGDNIIDENTGGSPCTTASDAPGTEICIGGELVCQGCDPGETRNDICDCGFVRVDVCLDGVWRLGSCDGCEQPEEVCECTPGEEMIKRCDTCEGLDCGATCVGATFKCGDDCKWDQLGPCEAQIPTCDSDELLTEECGKCGVREKTCDGCFWVDTVCQDQGTCMPGEARTIPCGEESCAIGFVSRLECNDSCEWNPPADCQGCPVGAVAQTEIPCLPGHDCGGLVELTSCVAAQSFDICSGESSIVQGQQVTETIGECHIECIPGTTEYCRLEDGRGGQREIACSEQCTSTGSAGECGSTINSCFPGEQRNTDIGCGCGVSYTRVATCNENGYGWSSSYQGYENCPECQPGARRSTGCQTDEGSCGTGQLVCTSECMFPEEPAVCEPLNSACTPNETVVEHFSCGPNSCGKEYTVTRTCSENGCGWSAPIEDRSVCPSCSAGEERGTGDLCEPARGPACGYEKELCDQTTCEWTEQACPACNG